MVAAGRPVSGGTHLADDGAVAEGNVRPGEVA